jgi:hypothetical protein
MPVSCQQREIAIDTNVTIVTLYKPEYTQNTKESQG